MGFFFGFASPVTDLLAGETDGLAVNFADTSDFALSTWGMQAVQERNSSVDTLQSPHVFFTQSGTSPKYVKTSSTAIGWSPHNLHIQSQTFNSVWAVSNSTVANNQTTAPDGTNTAAKITGTGNDVIVYSNNTGSFFPTYAPSIVYTASCYAKKSNKDYFRFVVSNGSFNDRQNCWFDINSGALGSATTSGSTVSLIGRTITSVGSGWYRCTITFVDTSDPAGDQFGLVLGVAAADTGDGVSSDEIYVWGAQINRGYSATAYIKTVAAAVIGLPISYGEGLLVEPAATNICLNSQTFEDAGGTDAWVLQGTASSVSANSTTAPDGSTTADTLIEGSGTNNFGIGHMSTAAITVSNAVYTASVYAKTKENNWLEILIGSNDSFTKYVGAAFDLNAGNAGTIRNVTYTGTSTITAVGNGWYRCTLTTSALDANATTGMYLETSDGDNFAALHVGDSASGTYVWGAQFELGTVATSYIPTVAASVTRARDNLSVLTSAFPTGAAMSMYIKANLLKYDGGGDLIGFVDDGVNTEIMTFYTLSPNMHLYAEDNNVTQANFAIQGFSLSADTKAAGRFATNDFHAALGGSLAASPDTSGTVPTGYNTLRIGQNTDLSSPTNALGLIKELVIVPRAWNNTELQSKTT